MKVTLKIWICVAIIFIGVLCIPYSTTNVPEWKIRVIDSNGHSAPNIEVTQHWSFGRGSSEQRHSLVSDEQGYVVFPPRNLTQPLILRLLVISLENIENIVTPHGSVKGAKASIRTKNSYWLWWHEGGEMKDTLIIRQ